MTETKYLPSPEQAALINAVSALSINGNTLDKIIDGAATLVRGARVLLRDDNGYYDGENNDAVEEILDIVGKRLSWLSIVMSSDMEPSSWEVNLCKANSKTA